MKIRDFIGGIVVGAAVAAGGFFLIQGESEGGSGRADEGYGDGIQSRVSHSITSEDSALRPALEVAAFQSWSVERIQEELADLKSLSRGDRAMWLPHLYDAWAKKDPAGALQSARHLTDLKNEAVAVILSRWVEADAQSAAEFYRKNAIQLFVPNDLEPWNQVSGSEIVGQKLAQVDPSGAVDWARLLPDLTDKNHALKVIFEEIAQEDPKVLLGRLNDLRVHEQNVGMKALVKHWAAQDANTAIAWVNELDEMQRRLIFPDLIEGLAAKDPRLAGTYLEYLEENRDASIEKIVTPWYSEEPETAAQWLREHTKVDEQQGFMKPLMDHWISENLAEAKGWVLDQAAGQSRDIAVEAYIASASTGFENHDELIRLAREEIQDPQLKERAMTQALVAWSRKDRDAARIYAEKDAQLSEEALGNFFYQANADLPLNR